VTGDVERDRKNICPCPQHHGDIARDGVCECGLFASREFAERYRAGISIVPYQPFSQQDVEKMAGKERTKQMT
jgi:ferredoxin-thioredoxin reductase catalytic subunit